MKQIRYKSAFIFSLNQNELEMCDRAKVCAKDDGIEIYSD